MLLQMNANLSVNCLDQASDHFFIRFYACGDENSLTLLRMNHTSAYRTFKLKFNLKHSWHGNKLTLVSYHL